MRGLAVLLVLGRHIIHFPDSLPHFPGVLFLYWKRAGWIGVDLFFVLSGFLVSGLLFSEHKASGRIDFGKFFIRRGLKIYPAFWFFLAVGAAVCGTLGLHPLPDTRLLAAELLFLQNYLPGQWAHTWTLAVEEHFYILLILLCLLLARRRTKEPFKPLLFLVPAIAAAMLLGRLHAAYVHQAPWATMLTRTHWRVDALLFGTFLSFLVHYRPAALRFLSDRRFFWTTLAAALLCLLPAFFLPLRFSRFMPSAGFTLLFLGFGGILLCALQAWPAKDAWVKKLSPLAAVGRHSYSIYLWHLAAYAWGVAAVRKVTGNADSFYLEVAVYVAGSLILGIAAAKIVEEPVLRLRNKIFPSNA